jgi:hypothetical protein
MHKSEVSANPFALMMNPEAVIAAMNRSERLSRLTSHVCRPLDKPIPFKPLDLAPADEEGPERHDS